MKQSSGSKLLERLSTVERLPTLRGVVARVLAAIDDPEVDLAQVAGLISQDPAIAAQILRISNSIFYNASGMSTNSVREAVARIGSREVRNLVVSLAVVDAFADQQAGFDYPAFWKHSFTTALAAGEVAARVPKLTLRGGPRDNPYFLAGLLHDIGTLLLCQQLGKDYLAVLERGRREGRRLEEVERETFGFDHQDVGAALIRRWGLPFEVAAAAEFHHRPDDAPKPCFDYVAVVHGANLIATVRGIGGPEQAPPGELLALAHLGIDEALLPEVIETVEQAALTSELLLSIAMRR